MTPLQNFLGWLAGVTCLLSPALAQGNPSDPLPPILSLTITAPAEGSRFTRGAPIPIRATAVDPQGAVYRLEFYAGRVRIGVSEIFTLVAIPPGEPVYHEFVWRDAPRGRHELRVKATGSGEFPQWSAPVTITLDDATPQPLTFEAPLDGSVWRTPGQIPLEITAVDPDGEIRRVEFFANEQLLGVSQILTRDVEIPGRPRTHWFTWTNPPAGTHRLQATAVAVRGGNVSSETRTIRVLEGNNHVFAFQEPPDQAQFALGEPIPIRVLTIWSDGYIDHLEFLADGKKIGDSVINFIQQPAPGTPILHEFIWNGAPPGEHRLTAQTILADGVLLESSESRIIRVGSGDQELPIVTVQTGRPYALEGDRFNRGEFIIQRTGDLTEDLSIYVTLSGRATRGVDYQLVLEPCDDCLKPDEEITGDTVVVPAGQAQVVVGVLANFDLLLAMEPVLESVQLQVYTPPTTAMVGARPPYIAGVPDQATVSVVDRQNPNGAELIMVSPEANAFLPLGVPNLLQAIAVDPQGSIRRVEFVGNDRLLGVSEITTEEVDIPGRLRVHNFGWRLNDPADAGPYTLVARATTAARIHLESNPVHVTAGGIDPNLPVVSTTRGKTPAFERGDLKSRTGGFVLSRRGGTGPNAALTVFVAVSGTATLGLDYQWFSLTEDDPAGNLPFFGPFFPVTFPDGVADVAFDFTALADELVEGRETVTVQVIDPPILSLLPIPPSYLIGEPHSADVVIEDANLEMPSIVLTRPTEGAHFNVGDVISLEATAVHPDAGVEMIRFIADGRIIATVNYCCDVCDCAPAPKATPFTARYEWNSAPPGVHVLVAQTILGPNLVLESPPVTVVVGGERPASLVIVEPRNGAVFGLGHAITIDTIGQDPESLVSTVEFFANGEKIGEYCFLCVVDAIFPPGTPLHNQIQWTPSRPGQYVLTAVGQFGPDKRLTSPPVTIQVEGQNTGPRLVIAQPADGSTVPAGRDVPVVAVGTGREGGITDVELLVDGRPVAESHVVFFRPPRADEEVQHEFTVRFQPGRHELVVRDLADPAVVSPPVSIFASDASGSFVTRTLPAGYQAGTAFTVRLQTQPSANVAVYVVEDQPPFTFGSPEDPNIPPPVWQVTNISHRGVFDPSTGKVKFGPFFDHEARTLTYDIVFNSVVDSARFAGVGVADGVAFPIGGDNEIRGSARHPADRQPADDFLTAEELTAYAAAWKREQPWPENPNPIPVDYVTRAAAVWKGGEQYVYDPSAGVPPFCWINGVSTTRSEDQISPPPLAGRAVRTQERQSNGSVRVTLRVTPAPGTQSFAVEEYLPARETVSGITSGGELTPGSGIVRWGPFWATDTPILSYVRSDSTATEAKGIVSFDGQNLVVHADTESPDEGSARLTGVDPLHDGSNQVSLEASALMRGAEYELQVSTDLKRWTSAGLFSTGHDIGFARDAAAAGAGARFYRAVRVR